MGVIYPHTSVFESLHLRSEQSPLWRFATGRSVPLQVRQRFVRVRSHWDALHKSLILYIRNFRVLFLAHWVPMLPGDLVLLAGVLLENEAVIGVSAIVWGIAWCYGFGAGAIAVADICNGVRPTVLRSAGGQRSDGGSCSG